MWSDDNSCLAVANRYLLVCIDVVVVVAVVSLSKKLTLLPSCVNVGLG